MQHIQCANSVIMPKVRLELGRVMNAKVLVRIREGHAKYCNVADVAVGTPRALRNKASSNTVKIKYCEFTIMSR